jgi:hypothetical protein
VERRIDLSNLDLDRVEAAVSERRSAWSASGISDRPVTWTDNDTAWPVPITTRRSDVRRHRSLGIRIAQGQGEAEVIVYAGGWADVAVAPSDGGEIVQSIWSSTPRRRSDRFSIASSSC